MTKNILPALLWLAIITILSTQGGVSMPQFKLFEMDKLAHAAAYALLVWLILYGLRRQATPMTGLAAFVFASVYGALMEFVQYAWFPNRFFEVDDMLANTVGAAFAWISFSWLMNRVDLSRKRKSL